MDTALLNKMIEERFVNVQKHHAADLYIYNYAAKVQYDRMWNEVTLACRGLIMDGNGSIVARPFKKFFNMGEFEGQIIPSSPFEVYEKMDGSLGISYSLGDQIQIATRGSFNSEQALKATEMLHTKYRHCIDKMNPCHTYLFEIIYPQNRIVVDYGETEALILIAIIDIATGNDIDLYDIGFPVVPKYDGIEDLEQIKKLEQKEKEGFVIKFSDGYRLKVKFEEYIRLHRILTQVSTISIWEYLKTGQSMDELLEQVPDEFYDWVKDHRNQFQENFVKIENEARLEFKIFETRKETALYFLKCKYPSILFAMLDKKDYADIIWKMLRPSHAKPFKNDEN